MASGDRFVSLWQQQNWYLVSWRKKISPVLHTRGKGVHTSSDGTNGETRLDNWVRVEKHRLDDIQNICVSVKVGTFTSERAITLKESSEWIKSFLFLICYYRVWMPQQSTEANICFICHVSQLYQTCFPTQVRAPANEVCFLVLSGSPGSWTKTSADETLRSRHSCQSQAGTPPTYRGSNNQPALLLSVLLHVLLLLNEYSICKRAKKSF